MTEEELRAIEQWAQAAKGYGGCGMTCSGVDDLLALVAEVRRMRAELAKCEDLKAWMDDARERGE